MQVYSSNASSSVKASEYFKWKHWKQPLFVFLNLHSFQRWKHSHLWDEQLAEKIIATHYRRSGEEINEHPPMKPQVKFETQNKYF